MYLEAEGAVDEVLLGFGYFDHSVLLGGYLRGMCLGSSTVF